MLITCNDFKNVQDRPSCCNSCHDDADEYGYFLSGDGENYDVCCTRANWLEAHGVDIYDTVTPEVLALLGV